MVMHIDNNIQWLLSGDAKAAGLPVAAAAPVTLDSGAGDPVQASADSDYVSQNVAVMTGAAIVEWLETMPEELGVGVDGAAGETFADRLYAMLVGIADEDQSGDLSPDETEVLNMAMATAADFLSSYGVSDDDITALLENGDEGAATRVRTLLASVMPSDDDGMAAVDDFVFGPESEESTFDSGSGPTRKVTVFRDGKKTVANRRVGAVHLSAAQKAGLKKARVRSNSAAAQMKRARSMRARRKAGM